MQNWDWHKIAEHDSLTEGPAWNGSGLLYNQCAANTTWLYDPKEGTSKVWRKDTGGANGMAFHHTGDLYVCEGSAHRVVRLTGAEPTAITAIAVSFNGDTINWPNDLAVTANEVIYFSDPNYTDNPNNLAHESVYMLQEGFGGSWNMQRVTLNTNRPNGLLLSADQKVLYVAESPRDPTYRRELRKYQILENGELGDYQVLHDFGHGRGIDGMTLTTDGTILATAGSEATRPGPMLYHFDEHGRVIYTVRTPVDFPTNCTFGGENLDVLYVTFGTGYVYEVTNTGLRGHLTYPLARF